MKKLTLRKFPTPKLPLSRSPKSMASASSASTVPPSKRPSKAPQSKNNPRIINPSTRPPIILIHGFRGSPLGLNAIAEELREHGYRVYTPAIPPFAGAEKLPRYTPEEYTRFLVNYAKKHHLDHPILIGHSMGSIIVSAAVSQHPESFHAKSILLSPISNRAATPFRILAPLTAVLPHHTVDLITTAYLFVPRDRKLLHQTLALTRACSEDHPPTRLEMLDAARFSANYSVADFKFSRDVLMLAGEKDRLINRKHTIKLAREVQANVEFIPDSGHLHTYEKSHETTQKILEFLEK